MRIDIVGLGMGETPLAAHILETIHAADVLAGGARQLARFPQHPGRRVEIRAPLEAVFDELGELAGQGRRVVLLADGDPLFFGIGVRAAAFFGPDAVTVLPGTSAVQEAAARLARPWNDIDAVSLHGRDDWSPLLAALAGPEPVAVYTDPVNTPAAIAARLFDLWGELGGEPGDDIFRLHVFEELGTPRERIGSFRPAAAAKADFARPNLVLVEKTSLPEVPLRPGLPDEALAAEGRLMTKPPLRAAGIFALSPPRQGVLWDIGAGSGAMSLEAAAIMERGRVLAVESDPARLDMVRENIRRTHAFHVSPIAGRAPECLADLPEPDRIFIGGGLSRNDDVLRAACGRLKPGGRIVVHAVLLDVLERTRRVLSDLGWSADILQIQANRAEPLAGSLRLVPDNPVFVIRAERLSF